MHATDWLLLLIAALLAVGLVLYFLQGRARARETEMIRTALWAVGNKRQEFHTREPIPVTFDPSTNKAINRFAKTAVDMQGMIELCARYLVTKIPPAVIEDMEVPIDWMRVTKVNRQGIVKEE
jgi:hypothetical protein